MFVDAVFAFAHFAFAFAVFAALVGESVLLRLPVTPDTRALLMRLDMIYGFSALGVILAGIGRVMWGSVDAGYYMGAPFFWAKMAAFLGVGLLSLAPTIAFFRWRTAAAANPNFTPDPAEVARVTRFVRFELALFVLVPLFAVLMARGVGS